jgi:hypothetical protein
LGVVLAVDLAVQMGLMKAVKTGDNLVVVKVVKTVSIVVLSMVVKMAESLDGLTVETRALRMDELMDDYMAALRAALLETSKALLTVVMRDNAMAEK